MPSFKLSGRSMSATELVIDRGAAAVAAVVVHRRVIGRKRNELERAEMAVETAT